jgi:DNA-binding NtrC family response regulator
MKNSIIIIDDERDFLESVQRGLITSGFKNLKTEINPLEALSRFENGEAFDIALIDITMPDMDGMELLEKIKNTSPKTECIMITAVDEARMAVQCLRKGAYDYLVKPISKEDLILSMNRALERKRLMDILDLGKRKQVPGLENEKAFKSIITKSENMLRILKEAELHAASDVPVLITGETGTGKELLARAIHGASYRANFLFTPINMDAISSTLFDAEFFGHTKGAFTGAAQDRAGYLETTDKGTLFLDEIGSMPLDLQGKLLRVLQDGEYIKIGTSIPRRTDVRILAATNQDLEKMMARKLFRKDLFYRLRGGWLHLPPLKERKDDIPLLIDKFHEEYCGTPDLDISENAMWLLMKYNYPGNIRELKTIVQSAVNLAQGKTITAEHLPANLSGCRESGKNSGDLNSGALQVKPLAAVEKEYILKVYEQTGRNRAQTSNLLGIGLNTLRRRLDDYNVS